METIVVLVVRLGSEPARVYVDINTANTSFCGQQLPAVEGDGILEICVAAGGRLSIKFAEADPDADDVLIALLSERIAGSDNYTVRFQDNCKALGFTYIWQVAEKTEAELLRSKCFARKSLTELKQMGLYCGMVGEIARLADRLPTP